MRDPLQSVADRAYDATRSGDRHRRRCFLVPTNDNCAGVRINLAGREPRGIVQPGAELEALCDELRRELLALVEPTSGRPLVREVLRTRDVFAGERAGDLPDLLVRWHRDAPIAGAASPRIGRIDREYRGNRTGDHRAYGALLVRAAGADVGTPGAHLGTVSVTDVAPTIGALLGVPLPAADGRAIAALRAA
jgi:predicted AlkP superfamily phosphohydrolase/phosphomutase